MNQRKLRVADNERGHPRDIAKRMLKERMEREDGNKAIDPITNQHDSYEPPLNNRDTSTRAAQEGHIGKTIKDIPR